MSSSECSLKSLTSPHQGELLQAHNSLTFKLLKTVADFSQALATLHDRFGHELQMLVETFRKRNGELRKERPNCPSGLFQIWELFLQQVEVNSQQHGDISRDLSHSLGSGLVERLFHRKIQSKKVFAHKERIEAILVKSSELLGKCYKDYCQAYAMALTDPAQYLSDYIASHNVYVHQLQATNGMVHAYQTKTLPRLLEELEECHLDTSSTISSSLHSSSELIHEKSIEQAAGYQNLALACKQANHRNDLAQFVKNAVAITSHNNNPASGRQQQDHHQDNHQAPTERQLQESAIKYHQFHAPIWQQGDFEAPGSFEPKNLQLVPTFKNEIAPDFSQPPEQQQPKLEEDRASLEEKIEKIEERLESLSKLLVRSHESKLHNKTNELQEELCLRKFDLYVAQIHLSAVRSQLQLFEYNFRPITSLVGLDGTLLDQEQDNQSGSGAGGGAGGQAGGGGLGSSSGSSGVSQTRRSPQSAGANLVGGGQSGQGGGGQSGLGAGGVGGGANALVAPLGYRSKWIKAFKSLKETPGQPAPAIQKFGADMQLGELNDSLAAPGGAGGPMGQQLFANAAGQLENQHHFQEYTFKKIASCDVCKDFLRGHMRQGVKCKLCKISCHNDCQTKAHGTIKCQQPKIKLLRRQKSAGELEVNVNSDEGAEPGERAASSKPDSIYSLIRQVLDAKKRGQHGASHAPPTAPGAPDDYNHLRPGAFANSQALNLSTGNLALANSNGKSVSTSALQPGGGGGGLNNNANSSVDRWSVVMELLAQSRRSTKELQQLSDEAAGGGGGGGGGKRHSKQLDKFKLAARSVGKHQRYQSAQAAAAAQSPLPAAGQPAQLSPTGGQPEVGQYGAGSQEAAAAAVGQMTRSSRGGSGSGAKPLEVAGQQQQQQQQLLIQHTKSLPIGQLAPGAGAGQLLGQFAAAENAHPSQQQQHAPLMGAAPQRQIINYRGPNEPPISAPPGAAAAGHLGGPAVSSPLGPARTQQQQQAQHQQQPLVMSMSNQPSYQLLELQQQQLQSTSAPHSPQRKRFNLRMKSFSLDSPESPQVAVGPAIAYGQQASASTSSCLPYGQPGGQPHYNQQQPQQLAGEQHFGQREPPEHHYRQQQQRQQQADPAAEQQQQQQQHGRRNIAYEQQAYGQPEPFFYQSGATNGRPQQQQQPLYATAHKTANTLRPGGNQAPGRHQQQHRHSYHNQMPAVSYQYAPGDSSATLTACDSGQLASFADGSGGGGGGGLLLQLAAGRQCASQSSLNMNAAELSQANLSSSSAPSAANCAPTSTAATAGATGENEAMKGPCSSSSNNANSNQLQRQAVGRLASGAASKALGQTKSANYQDRAETAHQNHRELAAAASPDYYDQLEHHQQRARANHEQNKAIQLQQQQAAAAAAAQGSNTFVVLYDYVAQRGDEIQLSAGQLAQVLDTSERDWWKICSLDGTQRVGYFPSSYLAQLYQNERPLLVAQTIQVSNGETCDKLLRGQIVIHTGKQLDNFVTIRTIRPNASPNEAPTQALVNYIQCPENGAGRMLMRAT